MNTLDGAWDTGPNCCVQVWEEWKNGSGSIRAQQNNYSRGRQFIYVLNWCPAFPSPKRLPQAMPRFLMGCTYMHRWLGALWAKVPRTDYALTKIIPRFSFVQAIDQDWKAVWVSPAEQQNMYLHIGLSYDTYPWDFPPLHHSAMFTGSMSPVSKLPGPGIATGAT